ncbi:hypothetical protein ACQUZQ_19440 [Aeromonas veronii]|jgi:predicted phage tail protein|uniref:hypothetical protein n=1 Tax=Aeromonas TaxID=642 RepID=UPI00264783EF|nr:hypothetical protein [Aeromonas caviae]MDN6867370.1 hypothetical protein [Aeromonas caviae]
MHHDNKQIEKYQWGAVSIGIVLLVLGFFLSVSASAGYGLVSTIGAIGWFVLGMMLSPQVRHDLFGDTFERSPSFGKESPDNANDAGC